MPNDMVVYIGSYGYEFCDVLGKIACFTFECCQDALDNAMLEEVCLAQEQCDGCHDNDEELDDCMYCNPFLWAVGPFEETLGDIRAELSEGEEYRLDDLADNGTMYIV